MLLAIALIVFYAVLVSSLYAYAGFEGVTNCGLGVGALAGVALAVFAPAEASSGLSRALILGVAGGVAGAVAFSLVVGTIRLLALEENTLSVLIFLLAPLGVVGHDLYWHLQAGELRDFAALADAEAKAARAGKLPSQANDHGRRAYVAVFAGGPVTALVDPGVKQAARATHALLHQSIMASNLVTPPLPSVSLLDSTSLAQQQRMLEAVAAEMAQARKQRLLLLAAVADEVKARAHGEADRLEGRAKWLPAAWVAALR